jgi:hypothetical protein
VTEIRPDDVIELTDADLEEMGFAVYSDGSQTGEHEIPNWTPIICRTCRRFQAHCTCPMPETK